ncbi:microfibrillar-associated protein 5 isoform X10 [Pteropus alecto]|uniref:microfibrillar-associated protein 5 isoform X10 n=1 Tax=Pteropus alecto TaxID=9402 RepID=UPI000D5389E3|nr:microfibrillar-associated protein 5 isoform X10 [Pteropus alecto]
MWLKRKGNGARLGHTRERLFSPPHSPWNDSVNVTQATPETFTEDPSKLPFLYFFAFILGIEGLRMMSVQREMKTRKSAGMRNLLAQDSTLCIGQSSNAFISYVSPVYDVCTSSTMKSAPVLSVKNMKL